MSDLPSRRGLNLRREMRPDPWAETLTWMLAGRLVRGRLRRIFWRVRREAGNA